MPSRRSASPPAEEYKRLRRLRVFGPRGEAPSIDVMIRVVLVDDHDLVREGLRRAVGRSRDAEVVGEAASVREALAVVSHTTPQVVVIDIRLPDGSGIDLCRRLREERADLGLVIVTMYGDSERLLGAREAGASGFVSKDAPASEVIDAIRRAAADPSTFYATGLSDALSWQTKHERTGLTARELQVLRALAEGHSVAEISRRLEIGESTTKTHIASIYTKLGASNRAQVIMQAIRLGLVANPAEP